MLIEKYLDKIRYSKIDGKIEFFNQRAFIHYILIEG